MVILLIMLLCKPCSWCHSGGLAALPPAPSSDQPAHVCCLPLACITAFFSHTYCFVHPSHCRVVPDTDGTSLGGLPGLMVFGARLPAQQLLMLAGLLLIFGWKGALAGTLLWLWVQQQQLTGGGGGGAQPPANASQQARLAAAQDYLQSMFNQAPLGRGGAAGRPADNGAAERPAAASDPWAARGRPRRLTD